MAPRFRSNKRRIAYRRKPARITRGGPRTEVARYQTLPNYVSKGNATTRAMHIDRVPFPAKKMVKLPYNENITLTTATGTGYVGAHTFNTSSIFDPNTSGTGHQPLYADQLAVIYKRYRIMGVSYKITFYNHDTNTNYQVGVLATTDTTFSPVAHSATIVGEKRGAILKNYSYQAGKLTMKGYIPNHKLFGVSKNTIRIENDYSALFTTNPTKFGYLIVFGADTTATAGSIQAQVELVYYGIVEEPHLVASS